MATLRRSYAVLIMPLEVIIVLVYQFTPRSSDITAETIMFFSVNVLYFIFGCKPLIDAILLITTFLISHMVIIPRLYDD